MLIILLLGLLSSCTSGNNQATIENEFPTRRELRNAAYQAGKLTLVYGSQRPKLAKQYKQLLEQFDKGRRYQPLELISDQEISQEELKTCNCLLIGTPSSNRHIKNLSAQLPITFSKESIDFNSQRYTQADQVFTLLYYPNPLQLKMPLHLMTGARDEDVLNLLKERFSNSSSFYWYGWGYELYQSKQRVLMGHFSETNWKVDPNQSFDFTNTTDTLHQSQHYSFIAHHNKPDPALLKKQVEECEAAYEKIVQFTGQPKVNHQFEIHLYASTEEKGLMIYNTSQAHCNFKKGELHAVFNDLYPIGFTSKENELLLRKLLGKPKVSALERGLSLRFNPQWHEEGADFWAARLFLSGNEAQLSDLIDQEAFNSESELVMDCMSASLVDYLLAVWGKDQFLQRYANWNPSKKEQQRVEKDWKNFARKKAATFKARIAKRQSRRKLPYMKGFNFAHEGYNIYNGYISQKATESLEKLKQLGNNAVAIVPYSYMRSANKPSYIPIAESAGSENDESVIHSAYQARQLGMTTLLKPQLWLGSSWPGDVEMKNEEDWNRFFAYYYRWIRHYALMAEIYEMDILCIGVEFAKATIQRNEDWKKIIRKIRGLYCGRLTYAANWGTEFEQSKLWDELDYISINCYYPLSKKDQANKAELKRSFDGVIQKIEKIQAKYKKPVLFTEIGFRSVEAPWKNPHADADGRAYAPNDQALCYEVIFEGIKDKPWCEGIFWWKWPSYLEYQGNRNDSFTPNRKAAEKVVEKWFKSE